MSLVIVTTMGGVVATMRVTEATNSGSGNVLDREIVVVRSHCIHMHRHNVVALGCEEVRDEGYLETS